MKTLTFNQLQVRIFFLIFILFTTAVISYRAYIERPQLEKSIITVAQKELQILAFTARKYINSLNSINYDYAVWDQSYDYIESREISYVEENFLDDTFISLKLDGIFIFNEDLELVFGKGYDHKNEQELKFSFYDFQLLPENKRIFPSRSGNQKVAQQSGILKTTYGPIVFSITEIKRSNRTGEPRGFMLFLKLFSPEIIDEIKKYTMTEVSTRTITSTKGKASVVDWTEEEILTEIAQYSERYIKDIRGVPLLLLKIVHSEGDIPPILDKRSFVFISLFTILIFIVYNLISQIIIRPVRQLAEQIQAIDANETCRLLDESYQISELDNVSIHFNTLMATIARQKALLNQQAYTDSLTNITNRRGFEQHLEQQCQLYLRQKIGFTVIVADVDHFKLFNDTLGHIAGDEALIAVAHELNKFFKRSNDLCARYGGEEFIMLYSDIEPQKLKSKLAQIVEAFAKLNFNHPTSPTANYVTVSLGACVVTKSESITKELMPKSLILAADHALYQAKKSGRNCFEIIDYVDFKSKAV